MPRKRPSRRAALMGSDGARAHRWDAARGFSVRRKLRRSWQRLTARALAHWPGSSSVTNTIETDVLIVGAGPAGLAAAVELRRMGAGKVLVVDREKQAGGIPRHSDHIGFGIRDLHRFMSGPAYAARWV